MSEQEQPMLLPDEPPEGEYRDVYVDELNLGYGPGPSPALVESIRRLGVLQPLIVVEDEGRWRVLGGRRRALAARDLRLETVPAYVLPVGTVNPEIVMLADHTLRSRNRAMEVDAIEQLLKDGAGEREIALAVGLTVAELRALLPLTTLQPAMRTALREGRVAASVAMGVAKLPPVAQERLGQTLAAKGKVTAPDVQEQRLARTQQAAQAVGLAGLAVDVPEQPREATEQIMVRQGAPITRWGVLEVGLTEALAHKQRGEVTTAIEALVQYCRDMNRDGGVCLAWPTLGGGGGQGGVMGEGAGPERSHP